MSMENDSKEDNLAGPDSENQSSGITGFFSGLLGSGKAEASKQTDAERDASGTGSSGSSNLSDETFNKDRSLASRISDSFCEMVKVDAADKPNSGTSVSDGTSKSSAGGLDKVNKTNDQIDNPSRNDDGTKPKDSDEKNDLETKEDKVQKIESDAGIFHDFFSGILEQPNAADTSGSDSKPGGPPDVPNSNSDSTKDKENEKEFEPFLHANEFFWMEEKNDIAKVSSPPEDADPKQGGMSIEAIRSLVIEDYSSEKQ